MLPKRALKPAVSWDVPWLQRETKMMIGTNFHVFQKCSPIFRLELEFLNFGACHFPLDHDEAHDSQSKMQTCLPYTTSLRFNQVQSSATIGKSQSSVLAVQPFAPQDVARVVGSHDHGPCRVWCPNKNDLKLYPDLRFANGWWLEKVPTKNVLPNGVFSWWFTMVEVVKDHVK